MQETQKVDPKKIQDHIRDELIRSCSDITVFAKTFFPEHFHKDSAPFHKEIHSELDKNPKYFACAAPRGFAKTTNITFLEAIHRLCYRSDPFILILADSSAMAYNFATMIGDQAENNVALRETYGLRIEKKTSSETTGTRLEFKTSNGGMCLLAKGYGQSLRGLRFKKWRPTLIMLDDYESDEVTAHDTERAKLKALFWAKIFPCLDAENGKLWVIGTILHQDSLLSNLLDLPENWVQLRYSAIENGKSIWEEYFPLRKILETKAMMAEAGQLDKFFQEYMNTPQTDENRQFTLTCAKEYRSHEIEKLMEEIEPYILIDPAISMGKNACESAIVVVGVKRNKMVSKTTSQVWWHTDFYLLDYYAGRTEPAGIIYRAIDFVVKWDPIKIGVESVAYQKMLKMNLEQELQKKGCYIPVVELKTNGRSKDLRIMRLQPDWKAGRIYLLPEHDKVLRQFIDYPRGKNRDIIDAFAYIKDIVSYGPVTKKKSRFSNFDDKSWLEGCCP